MSKIESIFIASCIQRITSHDTFLLGQKSRLAFASLSLKMPNYLIMDEPTNHVMLFWEFYFSKIFSFFVSSMSRPLMLLERHLIILRAVSFLSLTVINLSCIPRLNVVLDERLIEIVCKELWVVKDKTVTRLEGGLAEYKKLYFVL